MFFDVVDQDALVVVLGEEHFVILGRIGFFLEKEQGFGVFGMFILNILV